MSMIHELFTRIAPTPSGYLHRGNLYSFVLTWLLARNNGGSVQLRIDDLDAERMRVEYVQNIFDTLSFFRLIWDQGPVDATDFFDNYSQHRRITEYERLLEKLVQSGKVYACPCSRKQLHQNKQHRCFEKQLPLESPGAAWRIHTPRDTTVEFQDEIAGTISVNFSAGMPDFVIRKKNGTPAYQVASLCDDVLSGINTVVRGDDLKGSTGAQLYLAELAGLDDFGICRFFHHPVLTGPDGRKLSKSAGSQSVQAFIARGFSRETILKTFKNDPLIGQLGLINALDRLIEYG